MRKLPLIVLLAFTFSFPVQAQDGPFRYSHITDTNFHSVTNGYSVLHTLVINNAGASAVITIYDASLGNCKATPSVIVAIITLPASGALPGTLLYDVGINNGICIQDVTAASDLTVTFKP
jgi:hypothetical protein